MRKTKTYDDVAGVFSDRNLTLLLPQNEFNGISLTKTKLPCACKDHPNNKMDLFYGVVKQGRFSCRECKKLIGRQNLTIEQKKMMIYDAGYTYIDGDLSKMLSVLHLKCSNNHDCYGSLQNIKNKNDICYECKGKRHPNYWNKERCSEFLKNDEIFMDYTVLDFQRENGENRVLLQCGNKYHPAYWTSWSHVSSGKTICRECYYDNNNRKNWSLDRAKKLLEENGFFIIDDDLYVSSHRRIPCKDERGFIYMVSIHCILRGRESFSLWKNNPYAVHNINLYCKLYRPDYEFVTQKYFGNKEFHRWKYIGCCLKDGDNPFFDLKFGHFINSGGGHPSLSESSLEAKCKYILDSHQIRYKRQKTFDGCAYKIKLMFDFYTKINNVEYCIEVDGAQHFMPVELFGGEEGFLETQIRDHVKNKFCEDNNIILIRIPYYQINDMESILIQKLGITGG